MPTAPDLPPTGTGRILELALRLLCEAAPQPGALLDIPCGSGYLSVRAMRAGWEVTPADLFPDAWQGDPATTVTRVDLNAPLPFPSASMDAVACCEGIEHIENPWLVLREFHRVLKPGGRLVVSLPNTIDLRQRFRMLRRGYWGHYFPKVPGHINHMGTFPLCHALLRTGYAIEAIRAPKTYAGIGYGALARFFKFDRRCGLPEPVRRMLSAREVLCGRTVVILATALNE